MTISSLRKKHIVPFEIDDKELKTCFSYFLYKAPTIDSSHSTPDKRVEQKWNVFIKDWKHEQYKFYASSSKFPDQNILDNYGLADISKLHRLGRAFICKRKEAQESNYECVARHLRNSIAHGNVYMDKSANRIYLLFEDYNNRKSKTAMLLFSKKDLQNLMSKLTREK
ncbi:MAG: hypothetical protein GX367_05450 [Bacteroidales bacterium]|nr:hypothetical protein [Bacteroidales bacterium]